MVVYLESLMKFKLVYVSDLDVCKESHLPTAGVLVVSQIIWSDVFIWRKSLLVTEFVEQKLVIFYYQLKYLDKLIKILKDLLIFRQNLS